MFGELDFHSRLCLISSKGMNLDENENIRRIGTYLMEDFRSIASNLNVFFAGVPFYL